MELSMFPEEIQAVMAKILFLTFAVFVLCFGRAKAEVSMANCSNKLVYPVAAE